LFERFTDRARRVVVLAEEDARRTDAESVGTGHLLLGLLDEGGGVAVTVLESLGISIEAVRDQVEDVTGHGGPSPSGHIPFTPRAKKVLELSLREALRLGHSSIGTEDLLLGLIREGDGVAAQVLVKLGADLSRVRQQVGTMRPEPRHSGGAPITGVLIAEKVRGVASTGLGSGSGMTLAKAVHHVAPLVAKTPLSRDPKVRLALKLATRLAAAQITQSARSVPEPPAPQEDLPETATGPSPELDQ